MAVYGIDVSAHQGRINWDKVAASGKISFAILRCACGKYKDSAFERNYADAKRAGVPVGVFYYSKAMTVEEAHQEAIMAKAHLAGKSFEYPIYYDFEWCGDKRGVLDKQAKLKKMQASAIIQQWCSEVEAAGYWVGIYASDTWFCSHISEDLQKRYATWSAKVLDDVGHKSTVPPIYAKRAGIWQDSWVGQVDGINTNVDTDICYINYPQLIAAKGLNGLK